jgi:xanthine dehydrogenase accessory factor
VKELQNIVAHAERARSEGKPSALATVVDVEGSAYRLPGARMLIVDGKWIAGSISGGCLEDDVVMRAKEAIARDEALVTTYDTTSDDDIVFGVGLGCKGVITILVEPIRTGDRSVDFLAFARSCLEERITGMVATIVRVNGRNDVKPGTRLVSRVEYRRSDIGNAAVESAIESASAKLSQPTQLVSVPVEGGSVEVFLERIDPPTPLVVFGAGHDAMPVVRLAKELGWHVTLADHRPAYGTAERFPLADRIVLGSPTEIARKLQLDTDTLALVMTHNYLRDLELLALLLSSPVRYLGLLGPRKRTDQLLDDLKQKGIEPKPEQLNRLYAPVGLDIGSEGPVEVALSIISEMNSVMTRHAGGHLRNRKRPIHSDALAAR